MGIVRQQILQSQNSNQNKESLTPQHIIQCQMNRSTNYDTKSSILSIDYKIPYEMSENSRIVQHLEQSQEQLQFLKYKLTEAYEKLQKQIKWNMQLTQNNQQLIAKVKHLDIKLETSQRENRKLKEVMQTVLKNRAIAEEQLEYTHRRYKKIMGDKQLDHSTKLEQLQKMVKKLKKENQCLEDNIKQINAKQQTTMHRVSHDRQRQLQHKIQILQTEIKKITNQKVTEITRLRHEIQCYQHASLSPLRSSLVQVKPTARIPKIEYYDAQSTVTNQNSNNINTLQNSTIIQNSKVTNVSSTKNQHDDSISKWEKPKRIVNSELSDDQKLTRAQMERKKIESQLMKIERLKRHAPEDRQTMEQLQKKIYEIDSEISGLKRKIRQKY